jgi:hypothetical protein
MAEEPLDAHERLGPVELEKKASETSRGPYHYTGPPRETGRILLKMENNVNASLLGLLGYRCDAIQHVWRICGNFSVPKCNI